MSAGGLTEEGASGISPLVAAAARGELPAWAQASAARRAHIARVAALMDEWAAGLGLSPEERLRWRAAAWLHDALRDAPPEELRPLLSEEFRRLPGPLLHGPAVAERVAGEADASLRDALRYHTVGHPSLDQLGRALYLADFLEPGRDFSRTWCAGLRARMPRELESVLLEVVAARIGHLLDVRKPIRPETASFWSSLTEEGA